MGGQDKPIAVVIREDKEPSLVNLKENVPGFYNIKFSVDAMVVNKTFIMVAQVAGFGPLDAALANDDIKPIAINSTDPTDPDYPYYNTIGFVFKSAQLNHEYKDFMDFAFSDEAREAIIRAGWRPLK